MPDNVTVDNGVLTDYIVSADEAASGKVQRVKLAYSADGLDTHVPADGDGLKVNLGADNDVTVTGTVAVSGPLTDAQLRATAVPVSGTVAVTGAGDASAANQTTLNTAVGGLTESVPITDTASSGLNGRLQRIAQRLSSLIGLLPSSIGQKNKADSLSVTLASDQDTVPVSGTFYQATQPVSAASLPLPTGAATFTGQDDGNSLLANISSNTFLPVLGTDTYIEGTTKAQVIGAVRRDADTTLVDTTNELAPLQVDSRGLLKVEAFSGEPLPITVTGSVPVDDNGGSITVDGTITANLSATDNAVLDAIAADTAAIKTAIEILDNTVAGSELQVDIVSGGSSGVQYTEGDTDATITGNALLWEDAANTLVVASAAKPLPISDAAGSLTVDYATTGSGTATGALRVELPTNGTGVIATVGAVTAITNALPAGSNAIGKLAANSGVDIGDVDILSVIPGTGATNLGKAVDAAAGGTDSGVAILAKRDDALSTLTPIEGDYANLHVDSTGALWVNAGTGPAQYAEDVAHQSGDAGDFPLTVRKDTAATTAGTTGDYAAFTSDVDGRLWVNKDLPPARQVYKSYNDTSSRGAGSAQVVWDPTSGKKIAVTSLTVSSYGTTAGRIMLFFADDADLTYSAGTDQPLFVGSFAPSASSKPGAVLNFDPPIYCATADRRLHYQNDAAISVDITVYGYEW